MLARLDALALQLHLSLLEGGLGLLEFVGEFRAGDGCNDLAFQDLVTCLYMQCDRAGCGRIECRADGGNDSTLDRDVADEVAALNRRNAYPVKGNTDGCVGPAGNGRCDQPAKHDDADNGGGRDPVQTLAARRCQLNVLARGIGDFQRTAPSSSYFPLDAPGAKNV